MVHAPSEALICQNDLAVILNMPDNTSNGLVNSPCSLLIVPIFAWQRPLLNWKSRVSALSIKVILFEDNFGIIDLRIWNAHDDDAPGSIVGKVKTFADAPSADAHEDGTTLPFFKDAGIVPVHYDLILRRVFGLFQQQLILVNFHSNARVEPVFIASFQYSI